MTNHERSYYSCAGTILREVSRKDVTDQYSFYCPQCKSRKSIRDGSFFAKSKLTLQKWLLMIYLWAREYPVTDAAEEAQISERVAVDIYQWLREVCTTALLNNPMILGGAGNVVQIDESLFRHKPKVAMSLITN
jgi:transposase-like protein